MRKTDNGKVVRYLPTYLTNRMVG